MSAAQQNPSERLFAQFLGLERQARAARDIDSLAYALVNDAQMLFGYRHAALLIAGRVRALTGISVVEAHAPFVAFVENAAGQLLAQKRLDKPQVVTADSFGAQIQADWQSLSTGAVFWLPLLDRQQNPYGGLWIAREQPWSSAEQALLEQLGDCYSHAWQALQPRKPWRLRWPRR